MAVEETSIIAAVSKTARFVREHGFIKTEVQGQASIGQVQIPRVQQRESFEKILEHNKAYLLQALNTGLLASMCARGGGARDLTWRFIERPRRRLHGGLASFDRHLRRDGCEHHQPSLRNFKTMLEQLTQETVGLCILSNLNDTKLTSASVELHGIDEHLGQALQEARCLPNATLTVRQPTTKAF